MHNYISAIETIMANLPEPQIETRRFDDAIDFILAQNIISSENIPPFANSAMDGFALIDEIEDISVGSEFDVVGEVAAGNVFSGTFESGQAVYITTGAPVPDGTTAIVPIEDTEKISDTRIRITKAPKQQAHIRYPGEDVQNGQTVFEPGTKITPAHVGMLATLGKTSIEVFRRPEVAFLATGSELVSADEQPGPGQIRNSNSPTILSQIRSLGCPLIDLGVAKDERQDLHSKLTSEPLPDVLVTAAGVSMGEYDYVSEVLNQLGMETIFWKVSIKPGKPLVFGRIGKTIYFGLPGNPVSASVVFEQFVAPALRLMSGQHQAFMPLYEASIMGKIKGAGKRLLFARGKLEMDGKNWLVRSAGSQGSHVISALAASNCFIFIAPGQSLEDGDRAVVQPFVAEGISWEKFSRAFSELLS